MANTPNGIPATYLVTNGKMVFEFYNPIFFQLQEETAHHPELRMNLAMHAGDKLEERLAEIAAYCGVLLDGYYTPDRLVVVADELLKLLKSKRTGEVYVPGTGVTPIPPAAKT